MYSHYKKQENEKKRKEEERIKELALMEQKKEQV